MDHVFLGQLIEHAAHLAKQFLRFLFAGKIAQVFYCRAGAFCIIAVRNSFRLISCLPGRRFPKRGKKNPVKTLLPTGASRISGKKSSDLRKAIPWRPIETVDYYHNPLSNDTTPEKGAYSGNCYVGLRFRRK